MAKIAAKTAAAKRNRTRLYDYLASLTVEQLAELCDDPARGQPGGAEVTVTLTFDVANGFFLSARDGDQVYAIRDDAGALLKFRTIEQAIEVLQDDVMCKDVRLDLSMPLR